MKTKYPIYILSKGRCDKPLTANLFREAEMSFLMVVEPQEKEIYEKEFGESGVLVLPENNKGVAFVRNWIKDYSKQNRELYHWQVDDNIKNFKIRVDDKNIKTTAYKLFNDAEELVDRFSNIAIAGMKHAMFAFAAKTEVSINKVVYSSVIVKNDNDVRWREGVVEDTDYSLQVLSLGHCTLIFNRLIIEKAATMKMKGGNTEIEYSGDGRMKRSLGLQEKWPGVFEITEQYGRVKVKPSRIWQSFTQKLREKQ